MSSLFVIKLLYNYNNDKIIATNDLKPNLTSVPGVVKVLG
jgi:hypothetical protein